MLEFAFITQKLYCSRQAFINLLEINKAQIYTAEIDAFYENHFSYDKYSTYNLHVFGNIVFSAPLKLQRL